MLLTAGLTAICLRSASHRCISPLRPSQSVADSMRLRTAHRNKGLLQIQHPCETFTGE